MAQRPNNFTPRLVGPGLPNDHESAEQLMDRARRAAQREEDEARRGAQMARRLIVAFFLVILIGAVFFVVLPYYGMVLPPIVPLLCFVTILAGTIMTQRAEDDGDADHDIGPCTIPNPDDDEGRPIGCCPGPRPMRSFRK